MINKISVVIDFVFGYIKYTIKNVISSSRLDKNIEPGLTVSLCSYHKRINQVYLTIESIFDQFVRPERVVLYLSANDIEGYKIPLSLRRLEKRGLEIQIMLGDDIRSYKKLHYELISNNGYIVTIDDDVLYGRYFISGLIRKKKENIDSIIFYRGYYNTKIFKETTKYSDVIKNDAVAVASLYNIPTGVSGVLYEKRLLDQNVLNINEATALCPTSDDLWYKFHSYLLGTNCVLVGSRSVTFTPNLFCLSSGLFRNENSPLSADGNSKALDLLRQKAEKIV